MQNKELTPVNNTEVENKRRHICDCKYQSYCNAVTCIDCKITSLDIVIDILKKYEGVKTHGNNNQNKASYNA